ncbi:MAG: UTRA domain-containing protein [Vibrio sp.]
MQYIQIKDAIVEQIESGLFPPKQKLPSERLLADSFQTTRITLREALSLLELEGRIYREDRRGWFISPQPFRYEFDSSFDFESHALAQNLNPKMELVSAKQELANKQITQTLQLAPFSQVFRLEKILFLDERPVAHVIEYVRSNIAPKLLKQDLAQPLSQVLSEHYLQNHQTSRYQVNTAALLGDRAQSLRATVGSLSLLIERVNFDQNDEPMTCFREYWRPDAIQVICSASS